MLTGTVLARASSKGSKLELLPIVVKTRVRTLQVFRQDVERCIQGNRVGLSVNGLDRALVRRSVTVSPPRRLSAVMHVTIEAARVLLS